MSPSRLRPTLRPVGAAVGLLLVATNAAGAQELEDTRAEVGALRDDLAVATAAYEQLWEDVETATRELDDLERHQQALQQEADRLVEVLVDRTRAVFKRGSTAVLQSMFTANGPQDAVERAELLSVLQQRERVSLEQALAVRVSLDQARALTDDRRAHLADLEDQLRTRQADLDDRLAVAETRLDALETRAARQRTIDRGAQQGVYACPMKPAITRFRDTWGHPRSGGRRHRGTDVFGPMGADVFAFTSGVISRHTQGGLGGISLYLQGDDGNLYYYTHLQGYAELGAVGTRVVAGDHVAYNGDTGNARGGAPHIHFERKPGGGASVNPYSWLAAACF